MNRMIHNAKALKPRENFEMKPIILSLIVIFTLPFHAISQDQSTPSTAHQPKKSVSSPTNASKTHPDFLDFVSKSNGFEISYPKTWEKLQLGPVPFAARGKNFRNVTVKTIEPRSPHLSKLNFNELSNESLMEFFVTFSKSFFAPMIKDSLFYRNLSILSKEPKTIKKNKFIHFTYMFVQGGTEHVFMKELFLHIKNGINYQTSIMYLLGDEEGRAICNRIFDTFTILQTENRK